MVRKDTGGKKIRASERIRGAGSLVATGNDASQVASVHLPKGFPVSDTLSPDVTSFGSDPGPWRMNARLVSPRPFTQSFAVARIPYSLP